MKKHIENFYKHIQDSCRDFDKKNFDLEEINKIVIAGMGGSAIAGLILKDLFPELEITVERNYFPNTPIDESTLVLCVLIQETRKRLYLIMITLQD